MNMEKEIQQVLLTDIIPNRFQPRLSFDEEALRELAESIKQHGIIQPLVLRKLGDKYEIIAGERRYKASIMAGRNNVPAIIVNLDDTTSAEIALAENIQRKDLTSIEEAESYQNILRIGGMTQTDLASRMGKSQSNIANKLRLLELTPEVRKALLDNKISERHARSLLSIKDSDTQIMMLNKIIDNRLTVRQTDEEIKQLLGGITAPQNVINNEEEIEIIEDFNIPKENNAVYQEDKLLNNQPINESQDNSYVNSEIDINKFKDQTRDINQLKEVPNFDSLLKSNEISGNFPEANNQESNIQLPQAPTGRFFQNLEDEPASMLNDFVNPTDNIINPISKPVESTALNNPNFTTQTQNQDMNQSIKSDYFNQIPNSYNNQMVNNSPDLRTAISSMREKVDDMNRNGYIADIQELDLGDNYQIIIRIQK